LEKWGRKCAYCGKENVPVEVEHIQPRCRWIFVLWWGRWAISKR
jgi:hypothetical protein